MARKDGNRGTVEEGPAEEVENEEHAGRKDTAGKDSSERLSTQSVFGLNTALNLKAV